MSNGVIQFGILKNKKLINFKTCEIKIYIFAWLTIIKKKNKTCQI